MKNDIEIDYSKLYMKKNKCEENVNKNEKIIITSCDKVAMIKNKNYIEMVIVP